jgi:hypothetical protein
VTLSAFPILDRHMGEMKRPNYPRPKDLDSAWIDVHLSYNT